jgi:hypothetical protein
MGMQAFKPSSPHSAHGGELSDDVEAADGRDMLAYTFAMASGTLSLRVSEAEVLACELWLNDRRLTAYHSAAAAARAVSARQTGVAAIDTSDCVPRSIDAWKRASPAQRSDVFDAPSMQTQRYSCAVDAGTLSLRHIGGNVYGLWLNDRQLATYYSAVVAAQAVARRQTGVAAIDNSWKLPPTLDAWQPTCWRFA